MGNSNVPPPIDARVEKCMTKYLGWWFLTIVRLRCVLNMFYLYLAVPQDKIQILWRLYTRYDMSGSGYLVIFNYYRQLHSIAQFSLSTQSLDEFFTTLLRFKRSALTDSIPEFMGKLNQEEAYHHYVFGDE